MISIEELYRVFQSHPKVVTDSRKVEPGCLFFALKGERFNGNQFAQNSVEAGAKYAIIDEAEFQINDRFILVNDVLHTLQELARHHRRQFEIPILAITGSNGKTTTKELINAVLSSTYPAHCTPGNFNNHIGLPLTLLAMPQETEIAVIEMGANHIGEIEFLCKIAEPTHGLITNIGKAHLEGFGGIEGVKKGKSELYRYLAKRQSGVVFVNLDETHLADLSQQVKHQIFYQKGENCNSNFLPFEVELVEESPFLAIRFSDDDGLPTTAQSKLQGIFNFNNLMTAAVIGTYFKVPGQRAKAAIENYVPANNRSQIMDVGSNTLLLDAYNANPTSMKNALEAFSKMKAKNKVAILGAMRELGEHAEAEHHDIMAQALGCGFSQIILVGPEFEKAAENSDALFFQNTGAAGEWLRQNNFTETHFLLKASRSIGLEKLVEVFREKK